MPILTKIEQATEVCGLGLYTFSVPRAGMWYLSAQCLENPTSGITINLSQFGSQAVSVSTDPSSATQQSINIQQQFNCQPGDQLSVVLNSSSPIDNQLNTVRTIINLREGL